MMRQLILLLSLSLMALLAGEPQVIHGHQMPPEPDPVVNDSTLLGIDVNKNGVRDDVEIWVIRRYADDNEYPKTKTSISLQFARAYQYILQNDPKKAYENKSYKRADHAMDCFGYFIDEGIKKKNLRGTDITKHIIKNKIFDEEMEAKLFNTKDRMRAYFYYNASLSGHILGGGGGVLSSTKDKCDFDIDALGELH